MAENEGRLGSVKERITTAPDGFRQLEGEGSRSMFTIKLYSADGWRQKILEADSFTVLRGNASNYGNEAEITLHRKSSDDVRYDIRPKEVLAPDYQGPEVFERAIIENGAGKTTEIISASANSPK